MGLTHLNCCGGKSYSGPIPLAPKIEVNAIHCNGRHLTLLACSESTIWMMTCSTLAYLEDLKIFIREGISKLCPPGIVAREYDFIQLVLSPGELGTQGRYLLVGLFSAS